MSAFNLMPKPTTLFSKIRNDSDDFSVDSTGSEKRSTPLELSDGPREKTRKVDRDYGYLHNSDLVIPQPRKSSQHSNTSQNAPTEPPIRSFMPKLLEMSPQFIEDIKEASQDLEGIKKYINPEAMDEEVHPKDAIDETYVKNMVGKYLSNIRDNRQPIGKQLGFHSMNLLSPLMLQHQFICNYMETKERDRAGYANEVERNPSSDEDELRVGKLTKSQRKEKLDRYFEKKKKRNWKTIRYEIRKDLAEKRKRMHGRFVKSSKKSITELAKAYKGQSMTSSMVSQNSPIAEMDEISRKNSFHSVINSMVKLSLNAPESPERK